MTTIPQQMMNHEAVLKTIGVIYSPLADQLLTIGFSKQALENAIQECQSRPLAPIELDIARMNLIGSLRSWGYIVSGGRAGGDVYTITGWQEKELKTPASEWVGEPREIIEELHGRQVLTLGSWSKVISILKAKNSVPYHEESWLYLWAYGIATNVGYWAENDDGIAVIIQKKKERPAFQIFNLEMKPRELVRLAEILSIASVRRVQIINLSQSEYSECLEYCKPYWATFRKEAVYSTQEISEHPEKFWNKRGLGMLRSQSKYTTFYQTDLEEESERLDAHALIRQWQIINERKHRQLAISRDHIAVDSIGYPKKICFHGRRDNNLVLHHLFDVLPGYSQWGMLCNEKALNYSKDLDGNPVAWGRAGTSDYSQYMAMKTLYEMGIHFINSGGVDGGGIGLAPKKEKFAWDFVNSIGITLEGVSDYA